MKIYSVKQIKNWDSYTIKHEPIKSIDLMERAAVACFDWIIQNFDDFYHFKIFSGRGNNGGDSLAIARLLNSIKYQVSVFIPFSESPGSIDFEKNLKKLKKTSVPVIILKKEEPLPEISEQDVIIDALFGTGLNKPAAGLYKDLIKFMNSKNSQIISIDLPSGLYVDESSRIGNDAPVIVKADYTLSFQNEKLAFLVAENEPYTGQVFLMDISLSGEYEQKTETTFEYIDEIMISGIYRTRNDFSNKGNYGYSSLLCGSYGMMGAAVLSASACLRSGAGKLTCIICETGYNVIQTTVPEAMCKVSGEKHIQDFSDFKNFDVVGIGPGIGKYDSHKKLLEELFTNFKKPVVVDADALNVMSENQDLYSLIPVNSIITPHPKEFERLFGKSDSDFERIDLALLKAKELKIYIVLKGHHTFVATPEGKGFFNSTGNAGMATAGAGDVLTGVITGLLAQNYSSLDSCILGVYLHGLAGDIALKNQSPESMIAGDIVENLGNAFKVISNK
ncbi:MAG: NAD(P)H-hydrate dehydratase [Ginsengibacter sp.]